MKAINNYNRVLHFLSKWVTCTVLVITMSCDNFVEVEVPNSQLIGVTVFEDNATANAAMTSVYASIRDNGLLTGTSLGISNNLGAYADELDFYGDLSFSTFYFFNNAILPNNTAIADYWNTTYNQIYSANAVYEGVQAATMLSEADANRLKGEALFTRALLHFYLANLYGNIPYITSTDYTINSTVSRMPINQVYDLIIEDLNEAIILVPSEYYTEARARPNKSTVQALLARVYLYNQNWQDAIDISNIVIENSMYTEESNPDNVFLKNCTETIWQLPTALEGSATDFADTFTLFSGPPNTVALNPDFVNQLEPNDLRKQYWIGEVTDGTTIWYYPKKYKQTNIQSSSSEYAVVLRLTEQFLIRAEAKAQMGDLIGALQDLNRVRNRAGLNDFTSIAQHDILEAILNERRNEFFTEYGHRFFDLKRFEKLDQVLNGSKPGWNTTDKLLPIPQTELSVNPNLLPQNPGY